MQLNKLGVKNSLYNNMRKKAQINREKGLVPKKPTLAMLSQERKIKRSLPNRTKTLTPNYASKYSQN